MFLQIYFVGQDKKDTSNIANKGYYNKSDFYNMIFDYVNLGTRNISQDEITTLKKKLRKLKNEKGTLQKTYKILNSKDVITNYLSQHNDRNSLMML